MRVLVAASVAVAALALSSGGPAATAPPCKGTQLAGTFAVVPGSPGAGNIVYRLRIRFLSGPSCFVSGLPAMRLLDRKHRPLPTHVAPAFRGGLTAVRVTMYAGHGAKADARFSPDVPGIGEPVTERQCEPTAYFVRVNAPPGSGSFVVPIRPPTPVCERGGMSVSALSATRS